MSREPGVLQRRGTDIPAAKGPRKEEDVEPDAFGILERGLALAVLGKPVLLTGHAVQTPRAEPVVGRIALTRLGAGLERRFLKLHGSRFVADHRMDQPSHRPHSARKAICVQYSNDTFGLRWQAKRDTALGGR